MLCAPLDPFILALFFSRFHGEKQRPARAGCSFGMAKDQNLIPMKSAFPRWLKRLDPFLENESDNAIYQAFRLRRVEHTRSAGRRLLLLIRQADFLTHLGVSIGFILLLIIALRKGGGFGVWLLVIVGSIVGRFLRKKRVQSSLLPRYAQEVFGKMGFHEQATMDLWMTGMTGRELLTAFYLENRERYWKSIPIGMILALALALGLYGYFGHPATAHGITLLVSMCVLGGALIPTLETYVIGSTLRYQILDRIEVWQPRAKIISILQVLSKFFVLMITALFLALLIPALAAWIFPSLVRALRGSSLTLFREIGFHFSHYCIAGILLATAGVMLATLPSYRRRALRKLVEGLGNADWAYNTFMSCVVLSDPDGARWAEAMRKKDPMLDFGLEHTGALRQGEIHAGISRS